jgi:F0F1-type ATP synthase membrane subunit b/b'
MDPAKLWYAVSFAVFIGMVYRPLKRFAIPALDRYREGVLQRMKEARALRDEAQKLVAHYSEELRDMEQTYASMLKKAKEDVVSMRIQMQRQHEQDKKALETGHTMQKNQAVRRMELDFESYILSFLLDSVTLLVEKNPELSVAYQDLCVKQLPQALKAS